MERPSERLKRKIETENLWIFILSILKTRKKTGNEIKNLIKKEFKFSIGEVTAYKVLYQLKKGKYVERKKQGKFVFYKITQRGRNELRKSKRILKSYYSKL